MGILRETCEVDEGRAAAAFVLGEQVADVVGYLVIGVLADEGMAMAGNIDDESIAAMVLAQATVDVLASVAAQTPLKPSP